MGKYAAISQTPSQYLKQFDYASRTQITSGLSDNHTFESDGKLIVFLWISQLALCCLNCCAASMLNKPAKGTESALPPSSDGYSGLM
mmetsp:Transcript_11528/g.14521  ORF Transcript_11528/g.14521 Transcript_11528/m.14521 type:complete len:87 (+) Transcript_11528:517-777(+)|eukprot:CAMPEP_0170465904 /NCGR_PEP_ID=MMETSP0123-20130129/10069_1 /TAXON_ID=182087 /ORGANISM="Favella ehrenbergii, Strain Fehren 1" /LENGTH=86 /DNA_ID=CAMNT_0010731909 /DNA_START=504 /DNA_END=767 /DNA_ORIENTATION=+